ncbi:MAG: PKD domain-containing protein [Flavobacteriales bacterium]
MGNFEEILRKKLEGHEVPYDASQWDKMEARLDARPSASGKNWMYGGIAAAVLIGGTFLLMNPSDTTTTKENTLTENTANNNLSNNVESHLSPVTNNGTENTANNVVANENPNGAENTNPENPVNNNVVENPVNNHVNPVNNNNHVVNQNQNNPNNNQVVNNNNQIPNTIIPVTPSFTVSRTSICAGEAVTCRAANANADCDLVWEFGDGQFSKESKTEHTFKNEGEYVISLRYHDKKNNKLVSKEVTQLVKVNATPTAEFSYESNSDNGIPTISFINLTDNAEKWNWNFGDGKNSAEKQPNHVFTRKGSYAVTLEVTNENGCKDSKDQVITINEDFNLYAPNTFSPDGDGLNDDFIPKALQVMDVNFTMTIYDQRGARMYQTSRVDSPWDGRNSVSGATAPTGAYVWVVTISNPKPGQPDVYKGSVTLLR